MIGDIIRNKWISSSIVGLIIFTVVFIFLIRSDMALNKQHEHEAAKSVKMRRQWELSQKADTHNKTEQPTESVSAQGTTLKADTHNKTEQPTESVSAQGTTLKADEPITPENVAPVRVSPHGFGPYPEIPEGAPIAEFEETDDVETELLLRVMVKKWNEGVRFSGASIDAGKVYLHYPMTVYVEWQTKEDPITGEITRSIASTLSGRDVALTFEQMRKGEIPAGVRVIEYQTAGMDPYEVLDLSRQENQ